MFLDPQDEVGPSISSSVVLCSFVLLVYIVVLVLVVCLCPSSVRVLATFLCVKNLLILETVKKGGNCISKSNRAVNIKISLCTYSILLQNSQRHNMLKIMLTFIDIQRH